MGKTQNVMRVSKEFTQYTKEIQMRIVEREHKVPSMTEVTRRIAIEGVHPYETAKKGFKKIGEWHL